MSSVPHLLAAVAPGKGPGPAEHLVEVDQLLLEGRGLVAAVGDEQGALLAPELLMGCGRLRNNSDGIRCGVEPSSAFCIA